MQRSRPRSMPIAEQRMGAGKGNEAVRLGFLSPPQESEILILTSRVIQCGLNVRSTVLSKENGPHKRADLTSGLYPV